MSDCKLKLKKGYRIIGVWLLLIGLVLLTATLVNLLDPEATITINGEPTSDVSIKALAVTFCLVFSSIGAAFTFQPKFLFEKIIDWQASLFEQHKDA